jgi:hypothetical protein
MRRVRERQREGMFPDLLLDDTQVTGYKWYDFESTNALEKVLVKRDRQDAEPSDIAEFSMVVKSLIERAKIYRLYLPSKEDVDQIQQLYRETA